MNVTKNKTEERRQSCTGGESLPDFKFLKKSFAAAAGLIKAWCYIKRGRRFAVAHFHPPQFVTMRDCLRLRGIPLQRM